jgi:hypothetical protein
MEVKNNSKVLNFDVLQKPLARENVDFGGKMRLTLDMLN